MTTSPENTRQPRFVENSLLVIAGLLAHAPLYYQLPRWTNGLDPAFVHPSWIEHSSFPLFLYLAKVPPLFWIAVMVATFIRVCRNYGWKLRK